MPFVMLGRLSYKSHTEKSDRLLLSEWLSTVGKASEIHPILRTLYIRYVKGNNRLFSLYFNDTKITSFITDLLTLYVIVLTERI